MKFVRTKSGRILTPIGYDSSIGDIYDGDETKNDEVVDTSDAIEELCDCIVYRKGLYVGLYVLPWGAKNSEIYGAIWTDKGLIYVAKKNEQGEFELI